MEKKMQNTKIFQKQIRLNTSKMWCIIYNFLQFESYKYVYIQVYLAICTIIYSKYYVTLF